MEIFLLLTHVKEKATLQSDENLSVLKLYTRKLLCQMKFINTRARSNIEKAKQNKQCILRD